MFPGGCDLATAEAVCADETLAADDLADIIHALVDKSLVIAVPAGGRACGSRSSRRWRSTARRSWPSAATPSAIRDAMAAHFAALCAESAAAYIGDGQRAWLVAIDQEQDNLRAALEWAVANDDAETALTIAGGASWPHWLRGTIGRGQALARRRVRVPRRRPTRRTRALALTGRGLIEFLAGIAERGDADLEAALAIFERHGDVASMALAYSFYAELAAARGDIDEARRRRSSVLDFYASAPDDPFVAAARSYSQAKLAMLDGDLAAAERRYRARRRQGSAALDRPVMRSMCLGMVADFDERAGDFAAAIATLEEAIETNDAPAPRLHRRAARPARLGLLQDGDSSSAPRPCTEQALDSARRLRHTDGRCSSPWPALAALHRLQGRDDAACAAATEALELHAPAAPAASGTASTPTPTAIAAAVCAPSSP